jgi:hypothetical protein
MPVDVLSLSLGYYHETPVAPHFDATLAELLGALGRAGTVVVCSAGNDATDRPSFPAAFGPWSSGSGTGTPRDPDAVPIVSVGALNPDGTVALFSNGGPWVRAFAPGGAVVSTMPVAFQGGWQPPAALRWDGHDRAAIDLDAFAGGFAVWSGTSFSAPVLAGRLAAALLPGLHADDDPDPVDGIRARARAAIEALVPGLT